MSRRRCCGLVDEMPACRRFSAGTRNGEPIILFIEELEALRLKDREGLEQAECAAMMGLTRPTFQRILQSARSKVATALVEGQSIRIEGGNYMIKNRVFECGDCKHVWEEAPCTAGGRHGYEIACPQCGSMKKTKLENGQRHVCGGGAHHGHDGHGHGHGCCGGH
ncbi:Hypothetical protein LUCI_2012 [Lucifera butyrica]|uniref:Uncharacterized protein n=1 Tax=Lucifera butyrica TaxID=1351585 RepID=A0A498R2C3_9FIRM|nr:DUF134 domain-containing protein [Lucifera butyrica]VBB06776.1 Hypothetical protein LUCI_2012 [Lucifera butyrica]